MSPDLKYQLLGLLRLAIASIEHGNDSPEADAVRNTLDDGSWYRLSEAQQSSLGAVLARIRDIEDRQ